MVILCLSLNTDVFAQTQDQLIAGAKKEGKLVVYASATSQQLQMYCQQIFSTNPNVGFSFLLQCILDENSSVLFYASIL